MKKLFFVAIPLILLFTSCKVEFSPNAEWKEVPVVWCVLDQMDDTTWVRVQRCYLGEDNLYNYTSISDSLYYPQESITVLLEKWAADEGANNVLTMKGDAPVDTKTLIYTVRDNKDTGLFASGPQPLYYATTLGWLNPNFVYRLVVKRKSSDEVIASAVTQLVGQKIDRSNPSALDLVALERPNPATPAHSQFRFAGNPAKCEIAWKPLARGRLYQPVVRFYYYHKYLGTDNEYHNDYTTKYHIDIKVPEVSQSASVNEVVTAIYESSFFSDLVEAVRTSGDNEPKGFCDTVDIRLSVCNEDLSAYIRSTEPASTIVQDRVLYTNINDGEGVGIFASRRRPHEFDGGITSFIFTVPSNAETGPGSYHEKLKNLNIGFEK